MQRRERSSATTTWDVLMAFWGGDDGGKTSDKGGGGWGPRRREKEEREPVVGKLGGEGWFSANFTFDFLLLQGMKSTPIYRGSKRVILFTQGKDSTLDSVGNDPNRWLKMCLVSCQIWRKRLPELAYLGRHRHRLVVIHPELFTWGCKEIAGDHLCARFVRFDGEMKH